MKNFILLIAMFIIVGVAFPVQKSNSDDIRIELKCVNFNRISQSCEAWEQVR